jgi:Na+/melibiose symporter-like transporter
MGFFSSTLGGYLLENISAAAGYYSVALLYGGAALAWAGLPADEPAEADDPSKRFSIRHDMVAGARYILSEPTLLTLVGLELCQVVIFWPLGTLLPVFASDVFQVGALGLGVLNAIYAVGGLVGALVVAIMGDSRAKGVLLLASGGLCGVCLILFARTNAYHVALGYLLIVSLAASVYMAIRSTLLQSVAVPEMRGRMASYLRLTWGFLPLGSLPVGALTDAFGARWVATGQGLALMVIYGVLALMHPQLRRLS